MSALGHSRHFIPRGVRFSPEATKNCALATILTERFALAGKSRHLAGWCDVSFRPEADVASYSITSSARASSVGGIASPSAFAVLRLMTNRYLDACSTGSSAGLAPLRILSIYVAARLVRST